MENCVGLQTYDAKDDQKRKSLISEQAFHLLHKFGWAKVYPDEFGLESFDSEICQQMRKLECKTPGWNHPLNKCQVVNNNKLRIEGKCKDPSCDCLYFMQ